MLLASQNGVSVISGLGLSKYHRLGLMGSGDIQALQQALVNLAIATGRPQINPGKVDGVVSAATVTAVVAAIDVLQPEMSETNFLILKASLAGAGAAAPTQAITVVTTLAVPLTVAANTAAVKYKTTGIMLPWDAGFFGPGWYTTPAGIGLILIGAFIGWKLLGPSSSTGKAA